MSEVQLTKWMCDGCGVEEVLPRDWKARHLGADRARAAASRWLNDAQIDRLLCPECLDRVLAVVNPESTDGSER